jgi:hypothetical protein
MDFKSLLMNKTLWVSIIVALALTVGLTCKYVLKQSNTPIEIAAEKIVLEETGVDIDFNASDTNLFDNRTKLLKELEDKVKNRSIDTNVSDTGGAHK